MQSKNAASGPPAGQQQQTTTHTPRPHTHTHTQHTTMSCIMPGNIAPADDVAPSELPDGFTLAGPGGGGGGGGGGGSNDNSSSADHRAAAQQQRDAHRQAILEQAMTPEALARLRRVKVGIIICVARRIYIYIGGRERERERERELLPCFLLDLDVFKQQLRILHRPNSPLVGTGNGNAIAAPHIFWRFLFTSNFPNWPAKKVSFYYCASPLRTFLTNPIFAAPPPFLPYPPTFFSSRTTHIPHIYTYSW